MAAVDGLTRLRDRSTTLRCDSAARRSALATAASTALPDAGRPRSIGPRSRASSYGERTVACPTAHVPPPVSGEDGFPSILIGRPSRVFTSRPHEAEQPPQVVAYQLATPGVMSSDPTSS